MIVYNVTCKVELQIADEWVKWMKETHIPEVLETGYFEGHKLLKLLEMDERDGITIAVQYYCKDYSTLEDYQQKHALALQQGALERFGDKFVAFRTILKEI